MNQQITAPYTRAPCLRNTSETASALVVMMMVTQRVALRMELAGMQRSRAPSAYVLVKRQYGLRGTREAVYTQFCELIEQYKLENGYPS